jgi:hypothetical protein
LADNIIDGIAGQLTMSVLSNVLVNFLDMLTLSKSSFNEQFILLSIFKVAHVRLLLTRESRQILKNFILALIQG